MSVNKYEALFDEILKLTQSQSLRWDQVPRHANADLILNPGTVIRQSAADFSRGENRFKLLLVEKKVDDPEYDFPAQKYAPELLILDQAGELVTTLRDNVISWVDLIRLATMIESQSENISKLFPAGAQTQG